MKRLGVALSLLALGSTAVLAQSVISARSGLVHYVEGQVFLADQKVESKVGNFPELKENTILRTEQGRAEVLLTPGVFLRLGENSSIRMIDNRLADTRVELVSGAAVIEAAGALKENSVTLVSRDATARIARNGLYRFDAEPPAIRVLNGQLEVAEGGRELQLREGHMLALDGSFETAKFDKEGTDALDRWSARRGEYIAMANLSAANSLRRSGNSWTSSGWAYNPYFGMFTFIPNGGSWMSPYGYRYWSPRLVYQVYQPPQPRVAYTAPATGWQGSAAYGPSAGHGTYVGSGSAGSSGVSAASHSSAASTVSRAPVSSPGSSSPGRTR